MGFGNGRRGTAEVASREPNPESCDQLSAIIVARASSARRVDSNDEAQFTAAPIEGDKFASRFV